MGAAMLRRQISARRPRRSTPDFLRDCCSLDPGPDQLSPSRRKILRCLACVTRLVRRRMCCPVSLRSDTQRNAEDEISMNAFHALL